MKKTLWIVVLLAIAFAFPVSNLFIVRKPDPALRANVKDAKFVAVVSMLENKCIDCHSNKATLPFYANLPVVSSIIAKDIQQGTEELNIPQDCFGPTPANEGRAREDSACDGERLDAAG